MADATSTRSTNSAFVSDEVTVEECLWDCQWQPNPFYKDVFKWKTKLNVEDVTKDNTHLLLFTSPNVPRDLRCLEDCFKRFEAGSDWAKRSKVRRKCSANGLDRLIPTHTQAGQDFIESNYSNALLFWANKFASVNPNLDCLEWKGKKFRQKSVELSNFIDVVEDIEDPDVVVNARLSWVINETRRKVNGKKDHRRNKHRSTGLKRNPNKGKNSKRSRKTLRYKRRVADQSDEIDVDEEWFWHGTRQFSTNVEAVHRDVEEDEADDEWQRFMFRASNPVAKAVEICSLAKYVQLHNAHPNISSSDKISLFSSGPEVCDDFLPDLFKPTCRCVGRCKNPESSKNKIRHFFTEEGLWGCQNACKNEKECQFYTLSRPNPEYILDVGAPDVQRCTLWKHCDSFEIPVGSTTRDNSVSDHWSGPAACGSWNQTCPKLTGSSYDEVSTFFGMTDMISLH